MRGLQEQSKKHSVAKNCSDLLLIEKIVLVISKFFQILGLQPLGHQRNSSKKEFF